MVEAAASKITVDELKARFGPVVHVAPYGECLVVDGKLFDPDWEAELADQGIRCFESSAAGRVVTLVKLNRAVPEGKVVYVPPHPTDPPPAAAAELSDIEEASVKTADNENIIDTNNAKKGTSWVADDFIVELWKAGLTYAAINESVKEKFPGESVCVNYRVSLLMKSGRIQGRKSGTPKEICSCCYAHCSEA